MNSDSGIINLIEKFVPEEKENLVPFEDNEIVYLKNCKFKIRGIKLDPQNFITLEGISRKNETDEEKIKLILSLIECSLKEYNKLSKEGKEKYQIEFEKMEKDENESAD
jgi:hypothetical protein